MPCTCNADFWIGPRFADFKGIVVRVLQVFSLQGLKAVKQKGE